MIRTMNLCIGILLFTMHTVHSVNPSTVIYTIPNNNFENFSQLAFVAITPDGTKAYVTDEENNHVNIIDVATRAVTLVADPGNRLDQPFGIAINPDGTQAYVGNFSNGTVSIIDIASNTVIGNIIDLGATINTPYGIAFTPDGTKAYVTNKTLFGGVSVIDTASSTVTGLVTDLVTPTLNESTAVAFTPDGTQAYVANIGNNPNTVSIIDVASNTVLAVVNDPDNTIQLPLGIAFTPDGTKAYVANNQFFAPSVSIVDVNTGTVTGLVNDIVPQTLLAPFNILITADGTTAYVTISSNTNLGSTVSMINVATDTVTGIVGNSDFAIPTGLAITPDGTQIYVVNEGNSTISIIGIPETRPTNLTGCKTKNVFLTTIDFVNKLTWEVPASGIPVSYSLYRDAALTQLITAVPGTVTQYYDHNRNPSVTYTYYITAADASGTVSTPSSVVVTQAC